jgi:hypothetical protein
MYTVTLKSVHSFLSSSFSFIPLFSYMHYVVYSIVSLRAYFILNYFLPSLFHSLWIYSLPTWSHFFFTLRYLFSQFFLFITYVYACYTCHLLSAKLNFIRPVLWCGFRGILVLPRVRQWILILLFDAYPLPSSAGERKWHLAAWTEITTTLNNNSNNKSFPSRCIILYLPVL